MSLTGQATQKIPGCRDGMGRAVPFPAARLAFPGKWGRGWGAVETLYRRINMQTKKTFGIYNSAWGCLLVVGFTVGFWAAVLLLIIGAIRLMR